MKLSSPIAHSQDDICVCLDEKDNPVVVTYELIRCADSNLWDALETKIEFIPEYIHLEYRMPTPSGVITIQLNKYVVDERYTFRYGVVRAGGKRFVVTSAKLEPIKK